MNIRTPRRTSRRPGRRSVWRALVTSLAVGAAFTASACAGDSLNTASDTNSAAPSGSTSASGGAAAGSKGKLSLSGQNFGEATLVAAMYDQLLTKAGYEVDEKLVDTRDVYIKQFPGSIDVVPEYVGALVNTLNALKNGDNAKQITAGDGAELAQQGASLLKDKGITLLDQSASTDTNAFFVTQQYSSDNNVTKLSDLTGKQIVLAASKDCEGRLDCSGGLEDDYGIDVTKIIPLDFGSDSVFQAVRTGEAQLGETSTTDGTVSAQGMVLLEDDKTIQPAQNLVPAVSTEFLQAHPDVADVLNPLMAALTTDKLAQLNAEISVERKQPDAVATEFLTEAGLL